MGNTSIIGIKDEKYADWHILGQFWDEIGSKCVLCILCILLITRAYQDPFHIPFLDHNLMVHWNENGFMLVKSGSIG